MRIFCAIFIWIFLLIPSLAQVIPPQEEAGRAAQRFEPSITPQAQPPEDFIRLESTTPPPQANQVQLNISSVRLNGSTIYGGEVVQTIIGDTVVQTNLSVVFAAAEKLTKRYRDDGYVLSRVIVPPQELDPKGADIRLEAIEGFIDQVEWPAEIGGFRDLFSGFTKKIKASRPLNIRILERYLLLASDLPGLNFSSTLRRSNTNQRASTLVIEFTDQEHVDAAAQIDNRGTDGRGPLQYTLFGSIHNTLKQHETLQLTYAAAFEFEELQFFGGTYSQVLTSEGLSASISGNFDRGEPGTAALSAIAFESRSFSVVGELSYPLIRRRERNLTLAGSLFARNLTNEALAATLSEDQVRGFRIRAEFDQFDRFNGVTQVIGTFSQGVDGLGSTSNDNPLATRAAGRVDFTKLELGISRFQSLPHDFSLVARANGQFAFTPLLSSEECTFGGSAFGRAFEPSVLAGDTCIQLSTELRYDLSIPNSPLSQTQLYSFVDYASVFSRSPALGTPATSEAGSAGFGVRLGYKDFITGTFEGARQVSGSIDDDGWEFFFNLSARY